MKKTTTLLLLLFTTWLAIQAQNTVGLLQHTDSLAQPGYNMIYPHNQPNVYLLDNCGRVVNKWTDSTNMCPGNVAYLLDNGHLIRCNRPCVFLNDPIWAGGGGEYVQELDWDGNLIWQYQWNDSTGRFHHDVAPMPNGNVLAIAWEMKSRTQALDAGRDPGFMPEDMVWPEVIVELQPNGNGGADIVWEWHAWDHLIQDFDPTKANYGTISDHPELIDINAGDSLADWQHANAIHYNPDLDQIVISVPTFNEIWIIDHSTTTAEAASHSGGIAGKGGDLIYRWGNPAAYGRGDSSDQQLGFQHDVHWIDRGLSPGLELDFGKLMIYNNLAGPNRSELVIIAPVWDTITHSYAMTGGTYGPATYDWSYTTPNPSDMFSSGLSSGQRLTNGNTLIMVGRSGRAFEITPTEQVVWEYKVPLIVGQPATQGDIIGSSQNLTFRIHRYATSHPAIASRVLVAGDYIELNPNTSFCTLPAVATQDPRADIRAIYPNPTNGQITIERTTGTPALLEVYGLQGRRVHTQTISGLQATLTLDTQADGLYFLHLNQKSTAKILLQH